ncbi:MAG: DsbA family oxidoreductase [Betaproteobacteria bacterium]|nr:DsbA family oxidoreductase [Betaproteobacteria bacterium]
MNIDIISDVVCPWCYIGKRQIEAALALYAQQHPGADKPSLSWRPFQLNPQLPAEGMSRQDYVVQKFGAARAKDVYTRVTAAGAEYGIAFAFDRITRQPNTVAAHSLIALAGTAGLKAEGLQDRVKEAFLHAYFLDGVDLTRTENLVAIATGAGLDRTKVEQCLADPQSRQAVGEEDQRVRAIGVEGVPFFIFNGKLAVSGAQGPQALLDAMRQAETALA